ncbi:MAG: GDSL-like Lipase/Acylhydrolase [Frankiales bacterium]|nr:GDSL-like Lipase/Acylhydrolase [Frankiales bacterium]
MRRLRWGAVLLLLPGCSAATGATPPAGVPAQIWRTAAAQAMSTTRAAAVVDETCRQVLRVSTGGAAVRLRLSNALTPTALTLTAVTVGLRSQGAALQPGTLRPVTVGGASRIVVPRGSVALSDPIPLPVTAGADVAVSFAVQGRTRVTEHAAGAATGWCSGPGTGDLTATTDGGPFGQPARDGLVLDDVEVTAAPDAPLGILALGDSLTDARLAPDTYERWTDVLVQRLGGRRAVANAAIGGNRVVLPGGYGPTVSARLPRELADRPGVGTVVLFAGTNDVQAGLPASALADRLEALCRTARDDGREVVLVTLPPAHRRSAQAEAARQQVNARIRATSSADAVLDADRVLRDPGQPARLLPAYDVGDGLHLSAAGQRALGLAAAELLAGPLRAAPARAARPG